MTVDPHVEFDRLNDDLINLQASAKLPIVLLGRDLTIRRFSPQAEQAFHLVAADLGGPIGGIRHDFAAHGNGSLLDLAGLCAGVIAAQAEQEVEVRDARSRWHLLRVTPYLTADRTPDGAVLVLIDITERKRAEEVPARLAAIVTSSDDAIISKNLQGIIQTWNEGATRLFGYTGEEAIGQPATLLMPRDRLDEEAGILERLRRGETVDHYETIRQRKDGTRLVISLTVSPVRDAAGRVIGAAKIARDITDRKRAEALLDAQREALQMLAQDAPLDDILQFLVAVVERGSPTGLLASIVPLNSAGTHFLRAIGASLPDAFHAALEGVAISAPTRLNATAARERASIAVPDFDADPRWHAFGRIVAPFGLRAGWATPIIGGDGKVLGTFATYFRQPHDPVPKDQAQVDMVLRTAAVAIERKRAVGALREADERKNEFLAMLGHELRNPLSALAHGLALQGLATEDPAQSEALRAMMVRQTERISTLLEQLLDASRFVSTRVELSKDRVDLEQVVRAAVETVRPLIESREHELSLALPRRDDAFVMGDAVRLTQVVENLLTNAFKYTDPGGRIEVALEWDPDRVRVVVRDTGVGMEADFLPHVFDVFTQAPRTLDRAKGGLGLGLPLVRRLVELHGGQVEVSSPGAGLGSTVVVTLPLVPEHRSKPRAVTPPLAGRPEARHRRILVVDNEIEMASTFAEVLQALGHQAVAVNDGPAALAAVDTFDPEVVIVDLGMPGMDGYEVARRLRAAHGRRLFLIAVTGYQKDAARLAQAGFNEHLIKPPKMQRLSAMLAKWDRVPSPA